MNLVKKILTISFFFLLFLAQANSPVNAQLCTSSSSCTGNAQCIGGYCVESPNNINQGFLQTGAAGNILSRLYSFILPVMGIVGFLFILWAGIQFLTSRGDPKALAAAQARLTYAIIGLVVIFLAYAITALFTFLFGIKAV